MTAPRIRPPASLPGPARDLLAAYRDAESIPTPIEDRVWSVVGSAHAPAPAHDPLARGANRTLRRTARTAGWIGFGIAAAAVLALAWRLGGDTVEAGPPGAAPASAVMQPDRAASGGRVRDEAAPEPPRAAPAGDPAEHPSDADDDGGAPGATAVPVPSPGRPGGSARRRGGSTPADARGAPEPSGGRVEPEHDGEVASTIAAERELIAQAWRAVADRDVATALRVTAEHQRRFPSGLLAPEREAIDVIARCQRGDADGGPRASQFHRAHPRSPLHARVEDACRPAIEGGRRGR